MSVRQRIRIPIAVLLATFLSAASSHAADPSPILVELDRWHDRAFLARNPGPGEEDFILTAEAAWDRSAARDFNRFKIRIVLPNGQVLVRALSPDEAPPSPDLSVLIPASAVRNLRPEAVRLRVVVLDATSNTPVSNELEATIEDFPTPASGLPRPDTGPFGWGTPLDVASGRAALVPTPGLDGLEFVLLPNSSSASATYLAVTEATNRQVGARLKGYDPAAGRSDEFPLEAPNQPALNMTPERAREYLSALGAADKSGVQYRLPTRAEWLQAARAGRSSAFWWGDESTHPEGANFLGPEPALKNDTTAPSVPSPALPSFVRNPWGLAHTFGNVAEWASDPSGGFARLGGHFRTQPAAPLPEPVVTDPKSIGDDAFVGIRPAVEISAKAGAETAEALLKRDRSLAGVSARFDPQRSTIVLTGEVAEPAQRRLADQRLKSLWWVAAVENRLTTPTLGKGLLARLGKRTADARSIAPLGNIIEIAPHAVQWANPLPVSGSEWWVNLYVPRGGHVAYVMDEPRPARSVTLDLMLDFAKLRAANLTPGDVVSVALSLGAAAPSPRDPHVVSNVLTIPRPLP